MLTRSFPNLMLSYANQVPEALFHKAVRFNSMQEFIHLSIKLSVQEAPRGLLQADWMQPIRFLHCLDLVL